MSPLGKLFAAALIMATGLGVAFLLGGPAVLTQTLHLDRTGVQPAVAVPAPAETTLARPWDAGSVKLLPETAATNKLVSVPDKPALVTPAAPVNVERATNGLPQATHASPDASSGTMVSYGDVAPRAKLRNEAPRPMGIETHSPATIRRTPPLAENGSLVPIADPYAVSPTSPAPPLLPVGFSSDDLSTAPATASYSESYQPAIESQVAPPPWPAPDSDEVDGPRTHTVVDGDSLEKLAGRYLGDARRGAEIYELNRDLLSSPDLLPIDAELRIPTRSDRTSWGPEGRRLTSAGGNQSVREAAYGNLVPVRPMPFNEGVVPRAQLMRPQPVE